LDFQNVWSVATKDFETIRLKKSILAYIIGLPLIISILFIVVVNNDLVGPAGIVSNISLGLESLTYFFVVFAAILPASIAAYSIVGEKVEKSLEPLLATPMTDREILLGKSIAAFVPPILAVWAGATIFMAASDYTLLNAGLGYYYFPDGTSGVMLFLLAPFAAIFSIELAVIASSRLNDVRSANQIAGLLFAPFLVIFVAGVNGVIPFTVTNLLTISGFVAALDLILFFVNTSTFNREEILTRWK
jgi:ABC-2 type transport system permease protein